MESNKTKRFFTHRDIQRKIDSKNGKIHIGNITNCIRQSMITEQYQDRVPDREIWQYIEFMDGLGSEDSIVNILKWDKEEGQTEFQRDLEYDDFVGHPDFIDFKDDLEKDTVIFELKSSKTIKPLILSDDKVKKYIRQLAYYMVMMDIEKGRILVRYHLPYFIEHVGVDETTDSNGNVIKKEPLYKLRFHRDTKQFPFFSIKLSLPLDSPNRRYIKEGLSTVIKPIYQKGDITQVPVLEGFPDSNWYCRSYCPVLDICKAIPDKQTDLHKRFVLLNNYVDACVNRVKTPRA
jgi:hypothetical protein